MRRIIDFIDDIVIAVVVKYPCLWRLLLMPAELYVVLLMITIGALLW
jgi:hypothetical protein